MRNEETVWFEENIEECIPLDDSLLPSAERELAAFAGAVTELFGADQARQAVDDWMEELKSMDWPSGERTPSWRHLTIAAAARLASRVNC